MSRSEPALAIADAPNRIGRIRRDSCHTGIAEFATRTPVYVAKPAPKMPETYPKTSPMYVSRPPRLASRPAITAAGAAVERIHTPMFIGDVGRNTRSIFRKRDGRPRSKKN